MNWSTFHCFHSQGSLDIARYLAISCQLPSISKSDLRVSSLTTLAQMLRSSEG